MSDQDVEIIMGLARVAIQDRPNMVSDGNPQEQLARAFERHAERLSSVVRHIRDVGQQNFLGPTLEGEAATYNIRLGVTGHERSLVNTLLAQSAEAQSTAAALREIGRQILRTEGNSEAAIDNVIGR